jgi:hypothetical protein
VIGPDGIAYTVTGSYGHVDIVQSDCNWTICGCFLTTTH